MATASQLKALRRKYGLGEFKKNKKRATRKNYSRKVVQMARRKRSGRKSYGKSTGSIWSKMLGTAGYVGYEVYLSPMVPLNGMVKNIAELGVSYWLSGRGGIIGDIAKAGIYINTYKLMYATVVPMIGGTGSTSTGSLYVN